MLKAAGLVFASQGMVTILLFLRNILIARLVSVEDFGIASSFAIAFAFIETATNVGLDRMVVQDRDGNAVKFVNTLHTLQVIRGVLGAGLTLLLAAPYARLIDIEEVTWALMLLAWVPFVRGFMHLDVFRAQREMDFKPFARSSVISALCSIPVVLLVYLVSPDFQTMLWALISHQSIQVLLTHLLADRRFGLAMDWTTMRRALIFGTPLLLNGLVMFAVINGDRLIVGNQLGIEVLAWFSVIFMLTYTPTTVLDNTLRSVLLPRLSRVQADMTEFLKNADDAIDLALLIGVLVALGVALFGPAVLMLTFGPKYAPGLEFIILMGVVQGVRISKAGASVIALSKGRTTNMLYSNLVRLLAVPVGLWALMSGYGLQEVLLAALCGEIAAWLVSTALVRRQLALSLRSHLPVYALFVCTMAAVLLQAWVSPPTADIVGNFHMGQILLLGLGLGCALSAPVMRRTLKQVLGKLTTASG